MGKARRAKDRERKRKPGLAERVSKIETALSGLVAAGTALVKREATGTLVKRGTDGPLGAALAILRDEYTTKVPKGTRREGALRCAAERIERELGFTGERTEVTEWHRFRARIGT